ncbi:hypothetical protein BGI09_03190 [Snodgrassella alvi]|nr:hypothetical protein BGI09_03190 [Snodgrassella alvi]
MRQILQYRQPVLFRLIILSKNFLCVNKKLIMDVNCVFMAFLCKFDTQLIMPAGCCYALPVAQSAPVLDECK